MEYSIACRATPTHAWARFLHALASSALQLSVPSGSICSSITAYAPPRFLFRIAAIEWHMECVAAAVANAQIGRG